MDLFYADLALHVLLSLKERIEVSAIIVKAIPLNRSQRPIEQAPAPASAASTALRPIHSMSG
jgi:hypothetical protein